MTDSQSDHTQATESADLREWWPCICGDHHQGRPRHAGALTGAGLVMHAPLTTPPAKGADDA